MNNFKNKAAGFMAGRRGMDDFGKFLSIIIVLLVAGYMIFARPLFYYLLVLCIIYSLFRMMSRNIRQREKENEKFLNMKDNILHPGKNKKTHSDNTAGYRFFKCPNCGLVMRAPEGKGRIRVTCSNCGTKFDTQV